MPHTDTDTASAGTALSHRGFWGIFAAAWLAYLGLYVTAGVSAEGMAVTTAIGMALVNTVPLAALSFVIALRRSDLLRPDRSLRVTVLVHLGVAVAYSVAAAVGTIALESLVGPHVGGPESGGGEGAWSVRIVTGLFLYLIFAGFLMWSESLRRVHESRTLAAREAMLRAQAEAKALRAQFNPHFVFNTLHSLMLLVRADPTAAERAIEDVAELIRYASVLQRRDVDVVSLAKEMEVARRYLALEKLRLEDRLRVEWEVETEPGDVLIPAFSLQTLVENAVRHGLETRSEGGTIRIEVAQRGEMLTLTVADDGEGADPARVTAASGHGLQLLGRRLGTLYGEEASVSWTTAPGEGFTTTVRLPAQPPVAAATPPPEPPEGMS